MSINQKYYDEAYFFSGLLSIVTMNYIYDTDIEIEREDLLDNAFWLYDIYAQHNHGGDEEHLSDEDVRNACNEAYVFVGDFRNIERPYISESMGSKIIDFIAELLERYNILFGHDEDEYWDDLTYYIYHNYE